MAKPKAAVAAAHPPGLTPVRKLFGIEKADGGWVLITQTNNQGEITEEYSQPDIRPIIMEAFKIANGKHWAKQ